MWSLKRRLKDKANDPANGRDHLTGLYTLQAFNLHAQEMVAHSGSERRPWALLFLNIHNFRRYNRYYGYAEGDRLLQTFGRSAKDAIGEDIIARVAEDHFVLLVQEREVEQVLSVMREKLKEASRDPMLVFYGGIYVLQRGDDILRAVDKAEAAAYSLRDADQTDAFNVCWYNRQLAQEQERRTYISDYISKAIALGQIQVYYQPVMRTLTGKLCGAEALTRWNSPAYGLIMPNQFIRVLEESHQIHLLDLEIVRQICADYRREEDAGRPFVPVSINLSRLDFELCDIFEEINKLVEQYEVPKDMLHVELTESLFAEMNDSIRFSMRRFQEAGYEIWMDDFGSGYSSLNVLKDFGYDLIKIDMEFLHEFGPRARKIITSIVDMAKKLGIQTLAEGVETEEQLIFLKDIGCEKVQGYYFGKPQPFAAGIGPLLSNEDEVEPENLRVYYDDVGRQNLIDDRPLILAEYDGAHFSAAYRNQAMEDLLHAFDIRSQRNVGDVFGNRPTTDLLTLRDAAVTLRISDGWRSVSMVSRGQYLIFRMRCIAQAGPRKMHICYSIGQEEVHEIQQTKEMDSVIRMLYNACDEVYITDPDEGTIRTLLVQTEDRSGFTLKDTTQGRKSFMEDRIYPEDLPRYLCFTEQETIYERLLNSPHSLQTGFFRTKDPDGQYRWKMHAMMLRARDQDKAYITVLMSVSEQNLREIVPVFSEIVNAKSLAWKLQDAERFADNLPDVFTDPEVIRANAAFTSPEEQWSNLIAYSDLKLFWKDRERRYVGASRGFLEFCGLASIKDILGKRLEDLKWDVDIEVSVENEKHLLETGEAIRNEPGQRLVHSRLHNVRINRFPMYRSGRIIGMMGYILDLSDLVKEEGNWLYSIDPSTGSLNYGAIMMTANRYREKLQPDGGDFAMVCIHIHGLRHYREQFGEENVDLLMGSIFVHLRDALAGAGSIGRLREDQFLTLCRFTPEEVNAYCERIHRELADLRDAAGKQTGVYHSTGAAWYSETGDLERCITLARERSEKSPGINER